MARRFSSERIVRRVRERLSMRSAGTSFGWHLQGTIELYGGLPGTFSAWFDEGNRWRIEWTVAGIDAAHADDGGAAWEFHGGWRRLDEDGRRVFRLMLRPDHLIGMLTDAGMSLEETAIDAGEKVHVLRSQSSAHESVRLHVSATGLPRAIETRSEPSGHSVDVAVRWSDWRLVDGEWLAFELACRRPDLTATFRVERCERVSTAGVAFSPGPEIATPGHGCLRLRASPRRIFIEHDGVLPGRQLRYWGIPNSPTIGGIVHVLVFAGPHEHAEPLEATVDFFADDACVRTERFGAEALRARMRRPVSRFAPEGEAFHLRHYFNEMAGTGTTRLHYTLEARLDGGRTARADLDIPIGVYRQKTALRFPLRGHFQIVVGHEFYEYSHTYEASQRFAYDIIPLDDRFAPTFGPSARVLAPADGTVVAARDDIPDDLPLRECLRRPDPLAAIGGNGVVIDHGQGEYSVLFHLRHRSVTVKAGAVVRQGDVLGLVGSSGSPGYPHLHYHLQDGPRMFSALGLPSRFQNLVIARDLLPPVVRGTRIETPIRGVHYSAT